MEVVDTQSKSKVAARLRNWKRFRKDLTDKPGDALVAARVDGRIEALEEVLHGTPLERELKGR